MGDTQYKRRGVRLAIGPFRGEARAQRRIEGDERNAAWRLLSPAQQLASLMERRGNSARQVAKIAGGAPSDRN